MSEDQGPAIDPEQARQWAALVVNPDACVPETANLARWALARDAEASRLEQENARLREALERDISYHRREEAATEFDERRAHSMAAEALEDIRAALKDGQ